MTMIMSLGTINMTHIHRSGGWGPPGTKNTILSKKQLHYNFYCSTAPTSSPSSRLVPRSFSNSSPRLWAPSPMIIIICTRKTDSISSPSSRPPYCHPLSHLDISLEYIPTWIHLIGSEPSYSCDRSTFVSVL
jgi:hypothetical protein